MRSCAASRSASGRSTTARTCGCSAAPAFTTFKTGYVDKSLTLAAGPFIDAINTSLDELLADGKLKDASVKFFGTDFATAAAAFDLSGLHQTVQ